MSSLWLAELLYIGKPLIGNYLLFILLTWGLNLTIRKLKRKYQTINMDIDQSISTRSDVEVIVNGKGHGHGHGNRGMILVSSSTDTNPIASKLRVAPSLVDDADDDLSYDDSENGDEDGDRDCSVSDCSMCTPTREIQQAQVEIPLIGSWSARSDVCANQDLSAEMDIDFDSNLHADVSIGAGKSLIQSPSRTRVRHILRSDDDDIVEWLDKIQPRKSFRSIASARKKRRSSKKKHKQLLLYSPRIAGFIDIDVNPSSSQKNKYSRNTSWRSSNPFRKGSKTRRSLSTSSTATTTSISCGHDNQSSPAHYNLPLQTHNQTQSMIQIPDSKLLQTPEQRWKYQSKLAGDHQQSVYILDVSRKKIPPLALLKGITPVMAKKITEFRYNGDHLKGLHSDEYTGPTTISMRQGYEEGYGFDLPSFLDVVENHFPNLLSLSLLTAADLHSDTDMNEKLGVRDTSQAFRNSAVAETRSTYNNSCEEKHYLYDDNMEEDDEGKVYSADGSHDRHSRINDVRSPLGTLKDPELLAKFDKTINLAKYDEKADNETSQHEQQILLQRLYIIYRLPNLQFINGHQVTKEEKKLSQPISPSKTKVNCQNTSATRNSYVEKMNSNERRLGSRSSSLGYILNHEQILLPSIDYKRNYCEDDGAVQGLNVEVSLKSLIAQSTTKPHSPLRNTSTATVSSSILLPSVGIQSDVSGDVRNTQINSILNPVHFDETLKPQSTSESITITALSIEEMDSLKGKHITLKLKSVSDIDSLSPTSRLTRINSDCAVQNGETPDAIHNTEDLSSIPPQEENDTVANNLSLLQQVMSNDVEKENRLSERQVNNTSASGHHVKKMSKKKLKYKTPTLSESASKAKLKQRSKASSKTNRKGLGNVKTMEQKLVPGISDMDKSGLVELDVGEEPCAYHTT
uniref:Uncharacterized protein n=1 Tax=Chaetoceros debilis TaxID=122233 RepID=A0A7S3Q9T0_9STRA